MWQEIAVYVVGAGTVIYLAGWVYRNFFKKGREKGYYGCSSCSGCAPIDKKVYKR